MVKEVEPIRATHHRWDRIPLEPMKGTITRRFVSSERMMIAHGVFEEERRRASALP